MFPSFSKIRDSKSALEALVKYLKGISILTGRLYDGIIIEGTDILVIQHDLKRSVHWIIVSVDSPVNLYQIENTNRVLKLKSSTVQPSNCNLKLWVF